MRALLEKIFSDNIPINLNIEEEKYTNNLSFDTDILDNLQIYFIENIENNIKKENTTINAALYLFIRQIKIEQIAIIELLENHKTCKDAVCDNIKINVEYYGNLYSTLSSKNKDIEQDGFNKLNSTLLIEQKLLGLIVLNAKDINNSIITSKFNYLFVINSSTDTINLLHKNYIPILDECNFYKIFKQDDYNINELIINKYKTKETFVLYKHILKKTDSLR